MLPPFSLSFLTVHDAGPAEAVRIAAEAGYDAVGLRLLPASPTDGPYPLLGDPALQADLLRALAETGMPVADLEIVRLSPDVDLEQVRPLLEFGARIGARHVLVAGDDHDPARLTETFARFCALAAPFGLTADLEFMPWTAVRTAGEALSIVEGAAQPNGGVLVDALHVSRSGTTIEALRALPPGRVHYAQLCDGAVPWDASTEALIHTAREERLLPGQGGIDLRAILAALPPGTPLSVEVPRRAAARHLPPLERARQGLAAARAVAAGV